MHNTKVIMKDGRELNGPILEFKPAQGWMTLMGDDEGRLFFKDMVSAVTEGERISINKIGDDDLLARARRYMENARRLGWDGLTPETPKQEWEQ